jgi:hypothetical protein
VLCICETDVTKICEKEVTNSSVWFFNMNKAIHVALDLAVYKSSSRMNFNCEFLMNRDVSGAA